MSKFGFSWKRAVGITKVKRSISKATKIPLTKSGRQRKVGKALTGGCCVIPVLSFLLMILSIILFFIIVL